MTNVVSDNLVANDIQSNYDFENILTRKSYSKKIYAGSIWEQTS